MPRRVNLLEKANLVRKWILIATTEAGSGHPTSCLSAADVTTALFDKFLSRDDHFVLSKGHAAPLLYTLFGVAGAFPLEKLRTLRKITSDFEGHPTPRLPFVEAATGSLGQGLSVGCGIAYSLRADSLRLNLREGSTLQKPRVYVLLGDGEIAEGSVWEAANFASYYHLNNLVAIVDGNRLGQSQETMYGHYITEYQHRFEAFGWESIVIDGHDFDEIAKAFVKSQKAKKPFAIIAKTLKGKGISFLEDKDGWHGKPLKKEELEKALEELGDVDDGLRFDLSARGPAARHPRPMSSVDKLPAGARRGSPALATPRSSYKIGDQVATREVYGQVLAHIAKTNPLIYALDGDVKNSTYSQDFKKAYPDRFIECFIAEQNMVAVALGLATQGKLPFVSTFACFLTRACDQIRMAAISKANIKFVGSHAGVSIGEDGPSQMGLEDISMFGAIPGSVILHPADVIATAKLIPHMVNYRGISYLRTLRPKTPVIYDTKEDFVIGGSKVLQESDRDELTIVAAGITVHEALKAYELLKQEGIMVRIVDCYSVKPIDKKTLKNALSETKHHSIVVAEDHFEHGGLGDFVLAAVSDTGAHVSKLAVREISRSGRPAELLDLAGISAKHIVEKVKSLL